MSASSAAPDPRPASRYARYIPVVLIAVALAVAFASGLHRAVSLEAVSASYGDLRAWAAARPVLAGALFTLAYAAAVTISLPGALWFTIAAGLIFDWALGGFYSWLGATIGATGVFLAARTAFGDVLRAKAGPGLSKVLDGVDRDAFFYMILTRLIPLPFFMVNVAWALANARVRDYVAATAIGIVPGTLAYATVGAGAGEVLAAGGDLELSLLAQPKLLIGMAGLASVTLAGLYLKRLRSRAA